MARMPLQPRPEDDAAALSDEARAFIAASSAAAWSDVDLSPSGLAVLRADNAAAAASGRAAVSEELARVKTCDAVVGGVAVQWVVPAATSSEPAPRAVVLYVFGGGFVCGSPEDDLSITAQLAVQLRCRVCVPRYRLAPEHPHPAAREDVGAVYTALQERSEGHGVVVVGESAGGNLALRTALDHPPPVALALLSPWIDLSHSGTSHADNEGRDPTLSVPHFLAAAAQAYTGGTCDAADPGVSPLFDPALDSAPLPPTYLSTATRDLLLSDATRLADRLRARGQHVELRIAPGLWHVYEWTPQLPESRRALRALCDFLARCMR